MLLMSAPTASVQTTVVLMIAFNALFADVIPARRRGEVVGKRM